MPEGRLKGIPLLITLLVIAVLAISVYAWSKQYYQGRVKENFFLAKSDLEKGEHSEAIKKFHQVIKSNPQGTFAAESQYGIASAYKELEMREEARKAYSSVISRYGSSEWADVAQLEIGYIFVAQEELDLALAEFQKLADQYPSSEEVGKALYEAGKIYFDQKKYAQALTNFQAVVEGYAQIADKAQLGKADTLRAQGDWIKAIEAYLNALNHFPQSRFIEKNKEEIFYNLGLCNYNFGNYSQAIQEFDKVLAHPDERRDQEALAMKEKAGEEINK